MRVTPDAQFFTALSGDMGARRRNSDADGFARQAAISEAYGRNPPAARPVAPITKQTQTTDKDTHPSPDNSPSRREAPMAGQRPRFIPKGQTINLLV